MKEDPTDKPTSYSLFAEEEELISQAEGMVGRLEEVAAWVRNLTLSYRRMYREQQRVLKFSDRMQLELQEANQRLNEQAEHLKKLNETLSVEIEQRKLLEDDLRQLATTDSLTGLFSRRHFFELGLREIKRRSRREAPLSLVMMDLDHFKKINDRYGHAAGDQALRIFSGLCRNVLREADIPARIGGEEFAILLPDTDLDQAFKAAERLREQTAAETIRHDGLEFQLTVSLGVTLVFETERRLDAALSRADKAMYQAKAQGRNRTVIWGREDQPGPDETGCTL